MKEYGFIGAGKMAGAIINGILASDAAKPSDIICSCGNDNTGELLAKATSISLADSLDTLLAESKNLVVACKPQQLAQVANSAKNANCDVLISILAGTSIARLRECFPNVKTIIRVMPNMPAQISQGISCYAAESPLSDEQENIIKTVLSAIGEYIQVSESQLDAVTALSGSGPGYIFEFAAAMIEGAINIGFTQEQAEKLVKKTMLGSAMLLSQSDLSADQLRTAVSSPGGTTLAGLDVLTKNNFRNSIQNVLISARNRSIELSKL